MFNGTTSTKFIAPRPVLSEVEGTPRTQRKILRHFDRREKSFLDPSHSLGMTALGPSPWRSLPFDFTQGGEFIELRLCASDLFSDSVLQNSTENFKSVWLDLSHRGAAVHADRLPGHAAQLLRGEQQR